MSFTSLAWAARQRTPTPIDKLVLLQIASHVNSKSGLCNPSMGLIADETGLSLRRVVMAVKALEKAGLMKVIRTSTDGVKNSNHYKLSTGVVHGVHHVVHDVQGGSAQDALGVVHDMHINREDEHRNESSYTLIDESVDNSKREEARAKLKALRAAMTLK